MADRFRKLLMGGKIVPYDEARIHIMSPAVRYGATVFEGIRAYWNADRGQLYLFRCDEHMERLLQSARLMGMDDPGYTVDELTALTKELLRANDVREDVHIRPSMFVDGTGSIQSSGPVTHGSVVVPGGAIIDTGSWAEKAFKLAISSWQRISDNSMPPRIKAAGNYQNARLALIQAQYDGYDGVLMLDSMGHVTEEARGCVFLVRDGVAITPPTTNDILESITRETIIHLLGEAHGITVQEREVDRSELYIADEVFLCGTGLGVTPVGTVDRFPISDGKAGPVTLAVGNTYLDIVTARSDSHAEWLDPVYD